MSALPSLEYPEILRRDFLAFIHRAFAELNPATAFLPNWHLEVLAAKLEEVRRGTCKRLIINVPPRHLKSLVATVAFPAWLLGQRPSTRILSVSYGQDLSNKFARECRALMQSPFYEALFETRLSRDRNAVEEFETTEGGYRLSSSVGGGVTGRGAEFIIFDDPLKPDEAQSDDRRRALNDWYDSTLRSRLNRQEEGAIIIVMQRLHADDLVAHVTKTEQWNVLTFPAFAERDEDYHIETPYGRRHIVRKSGDVLHPALQSAATLETLRQSMTEYNFAAQYQQNPQPRAGLIVKRGWLKFYTPAEKPAEFDQIIQSWDTANSESEFANFSVCTTWGQKAQHVYLLDVLRKRLDFPDLKRDVQAQERLWRPNAILIEDRASGTQLIQQLRFEGISTLKAVKSGDSKVMRLSAQSGVFESGFGFLPEQAHWLNAYIDELTSFPNSNFDDQVDSTSQALEWMSNEGREPSIITYYKRLADADKKTKPSYIRIKGPYGVNTIDGNTFSREQGVVSRRVISGADGTFEVTEEEAKPLLASGFLRVADDN